MSDIDQAAIDAIVSLGREAVEAWITNAAPEQRDEVDCALRDYAATAPSERRAIVAHAVARAGMAEVHRDDSQPLSMEEMQAELDRFNAGLLAQAAPGHPAPKDMEPEEPAPKPSES